jgi:hypothetical protein
VALNTIKQTLFYDFLILFWYSDVFCCFFHFMTPCWVHSWCRWSKYHTEVHSWCRLSEYYTEVHSWRRWSEYYSESLTVDIMSYTYGECHVPFTLKKTISSLINILIINQWMFATYRTVANSLCIFYLQLSKNYIEMRKTFDCHWKEYQ